MFRLDQHLAGWGFQVRADRVTLGSWGFSPMVWKLAGLFVPSGSRKKQGRFVQNHGIFLEFIIFHSFKHCFCADGFSCPSNYSREATFQRWECQKITIYRHLDTRKNRACDSTGISPKKFLVNFDFVALCHGSLKVSYSNATLHLELASLIKSFLSRLFRFKLLGNLFQNPFLEDHSWLVFLS